MTSVFPAVQSIPLRGRTGRTMAYIVCLFRGVRMDYAREGKGQTDIRGLWQCPLLGRDDKR